MKDKFKYILLFATIFSYGCYDHGIKYNNYTYPALINNTNKTLYYVVVYTGNYFSDEQKKYYTVPQGNGVEFSRTDDIIITESLDCIDFIETYHSGYELKVDDLEFLKSHCPIKFYYKAQDLMARATPILSQDYATCFLMDENGQLEVFTEFETPWANQVRSRRYRCNDPNSEESKRIQPYAK